MQRCFFLASLGGKNTLTNPNVGAVLVYHNRIIGEGYHEVYGGPHAEVNAFASVKEEDQSHLPKATLYVSLEPCSHHGKTPPCADLVIEKGVKQVVISCIDPNPKVAGNGVKKLTAAGVNVVTHVLEKQGKLILAKFNANLAQRPYVILKWAQTKDGIIGQTNHRLHISNEYTNMLVHKWRTEVDGILVGTGTLKADNPRLTARHYEGSQASRITYDHPFLYQQETNFADGEIRTLIITNEDHSDTSRFQYIKLTEKYNLKEVLTKLFKSGIYSLMVEGGHNLLSSFIQLGLWDESRIIVSDQEYKGKTDEAIFAPYIFEKYDTKINIGSDICYMLRSQII